MKSLPIILLLVLPLRAAGPWLEFPSERDRTFRVKRDRDTVGWTTRDVSLSLSLLKDGEKEFIVPQPEDSTGVDWNPEMRHTKGMVALREGDEVLLLFEETPDGVRIYRKMYGWYALFCDVSRDIAPGDEAEVRLALPACGIGIFPTPMHVSAESVTLPAGTFEALRIDLGAPPHGDSLWIVRNLGVVKFKTLECEAELVEDATR